MTFFSSFYEFRLPQNVIISSKIARVASNKSTYILVYFVLLTFFLVFSYYRHKNYFNNNTMTVK